MPDVDAVARTHQAPAADADDSRGRRERDTVLFISIAAGLGGSTRSLATVLARLGPDTVRALAAPRSGKFPDFIRDRGLAEALVPIPRPTDRRVRRLSRLVAAVRIARWARRMRGRLVAIHANGLQEVSLAVPAAVLSRTPLVAWIHDFEVYPWTRRLAPVWRRLLRGRPVHWTAVSGTARRMIAESGLADPRNVRIVANPIDPGDILAEREESRDGLSVGFMASATARKGFHLLPDIDERVSDLDVRWRLFTGPSGDELPETWSALRALPAMRIEFSGKLLDVRAAYARCDVVLCPSLKESFCRVAAEAMMNGIPVVASDIEPLRELLGDGDAGILFAAGDSSAAADAIRRLAADPDLRRRLGERGRARATAFEPEIVVDRLAKLYGVELAPTTSS